jgi:hypothetical protein
MARARSNEGKSKSDIVRDYLRGNPTASVNEIVSDLSAYDISQALAQKIKYKDGSRRGRKPRKAARSTAASSFATMHAAAGESKADSIRRVAKGMGKRVRPRDVIAVLKEERIDASFAQVGQVLKSMGMRPRRRGGRRAATATVGAAHSAPSTTLSLEALLAAKKLADQLGSVQAAKQAMDALAKLS